jgi:glycosyltransferase involved in cell wall biosynthesis
MSRYVAYFAAAMTSSIAVCFDVTRLRSRLRFDTPTGIDRVDLAYLAALTERDDLQLSLVARGTLGVRVLKAAAAQRLLADIARSWAPQQYEQERPIYSALREWLQSPHMTPRPQLPAGKIAAPKPATIAVTTTPTIQWSEHASTASIYLNTSHGQLFRPAYDRWLSRHRMRGLYFVHDLIPILYPQFSRAGETAKHEARLAMIATHARAVLVNSAATRDELLAYWNERGTKPPPIRVAPLGVDRPASPSPFVSPRASTPYFVMLGTIEPRKNHRLLLDVWKQWVASDPHNAPRLVLAGRRGWENQAVFQLLDRSPELAAHLIECPGLNDAELAALLRGACALLNPSFAEGYGLPVAEALASGVPVIASALAAHREVGGDCADYLDPRDIDAWQQRMHAFTEENSSVRTGVLERIVQYTPASWFEHFDIVFETIRYLPQ